MIKIFFVSKQFFFLVVNNKIGEIQILRRSLKNTQPSLSDHDIRSFHLQNDFGEHANRSTNVFSCYLVPPGVNDQFTD